MRGMGGAGCMEGRTKFSGRWETGRSVARYVQYPGSWSAGGALTAAHSRRRTHGGALPVAAGATLLEFEVVSRKTT
jgi:hypothetical protein